MRGHYTYYFIYSSIKNHELCYCTSRYPDRDFVWRGTIVSNGDVGYCGRKEKERLAFTGTNHGSIEQIGGDWYVFYHRLTHKSAYSRQACAEKNTIRADGSIPQVEMTSCGLNGAPLRARGTYPAAIACNLTRGRMPHAANGLCKKDIPFITERGGETYITAIRSGTKVGYKYFAFNGQTKLEVSVRGNFRGRVRVLLDGKDCASIALYPHKDWTECETMLNYAGTAALVLLFEGRGRAELRELRFLELRGKINDGRTSSLRYAV